MTLLRGDDPAALAAAAQRLADGGLVAFATETVYGLGARADDEAAVAAVFAAKGRPADHPCCARCCRGFLRNVLALNRRLPPRWRGRRSA